MQWIEKVKEVIFNPSDYFKQMPTEGGYQEPSKFALKNISINVVLSTMVTYIVFNFLYSTLVSLGGSLSGSSMMSSYTPTLAVANVVLGIIAGFFGLLMYTGINHIFLLLLGAKNNYEASFRVASSVTSLGLISWIPFVNLVAAVYAIFLQTIGFSEVHDISKGRAFLAIVLPIVIIIVFAIAAAAMFLSIVSTMTPTVGTGLTGNFLLPS